MSWPILTVGPRRLPPGGSVPVWIDTGSGPGFVRQVATHRLVLARTDDGEGESAIYHLHRVSAPEAAGTTDE